MVVLCGDVLLRLRGGVGRLPDGQRGLPARDARHGHRALLRDLDRHRRRGRAAALRQPARHRRQEQPLPSATAIASGAHARRRRRGPGPGASTPSRSPSRRSPSPCRRRRRRRHEPARLVAGPLAFSGIEPGRPRRARDRGHRLGPAPRGPARQRARCAAASRRASGARALRPRPAPRGRVRRVGRRTGRRLREPPAFGRGDGAGGRPGQLPPPAPAELDARSAAARGRRPVDGRERGASGEREQRARLLFDLVAAEGEIGRDRGGELDAGILALRIERSRLLGDALRGDLGAVAAERLVVVLEGLQQVLDAGVALGIDDRPRRGARRRTSVTGSGSAGIVGRER